MSTNRDALTLSLSKGDWEIGFDRLSLSAGE